VPSLTESSVLAGSCNVGLAGFSGPSIAPKRLEREIRDGDDLFCWMECMRRLCGTLYIVAIIGHVLPLISCVTARQISKDRIERHDLITVETIHGESMQLADPYVDNDSLVGYEVLERRRRELRAFHLDDVSAIRVNEIDTDKTTTAIAVTAVLATVWILRFGTLFGT